MKVSVTADIKAARDKLKNYQKRQLPAATTRALNKTLRGTATDAKKLIAERINFKSGDIAKKMELTFASGKAGYSAHRVVLRIVERKKPNIASFKGTKQLKRAGVVGKPWKTRVKYGKKSFIWERGTVGGGKNARTAFHRTGKKRLPIKPIFGDSISGVFVQIPKQGKAIRRALRPKIRARFRVELERQIARIKTT